MAASAQQDLLGSTAAGALATGVARQIGKWSPLRPSASARGRPLHKARIAAKQRMRERSTVLRTRLFELCLRGIQPLLHAGTINQPSSPNRNTPTTPNTSDTGNTFHNGRHGRGRRFDPGPKVASRWDYVLTCQMGISEKVEKVYLTICNIVTKSLFICRASDQLAGRKRWIDADSRQIRTIAIKLRLTSTMLTTDGRVPVR